MTYWVYILASCRYGVLYVGVTNSLVRRVTEHREKVLPGFTSRYGVCRLVWHAGFGEPGAAIVCEKRLKRWRREWKIQLIEADNPHWDDLFKRLTSASTVAKPVIEDPGSPLARRPG